MLAIGNVGWFRRQGTTAPNLIHFVSSTMIVSECIIVILLIDLAMYYFYLVNALLSSNSSSHFLLAPSD